MPRRIQRRRTKGWRMPEGAVYVGRPTKWANPWTIHGAREAGYLGSDEAVRSLCVHMFSQAMNRGLPAVSRIAANLAELRGKDLACWCPLDQPCHADVLLELANAEEDT